MEELEEEWKEVFDSMQNKFGFGGSLKMKNENDF